MYRRGDIYYMFAPAGGVVTGWQLVMRSKNIYGPYESKIVMEQGATDINGPHQGALVTAVDGKDWFLHFQDLGAYGRVTHLNPVEWRDGWPVIGAKAGFYSIMPAGVSERGWIDVLNSDLKIK